LSELIRPQVRSRKRAVRRAVAPLESFIAGGRSNVHYITPLGQTASVMSMNLSALV